MDFNISLNEIAKESLTTKPWVENLIKPIFITYFWEQKGKENELYIYQE